MESDLTNNIIEYQSITNKNSKFILTSYFWGANNINKGSIHKLTYLEQVKRLLNDCKKVKVNYYFVNCLELSKPGKKYQESIGLKPTFIQNVMNKFKDKTIVYVDTDLRLLKYPALLDIDADCFFTNAFENGEECYNPLQVELSGGIMGFGNTHNGRVLLDILKKNLNIKYVEDKTFSGIITRNFLNVQTRCVWLPSTYLYMFINHIYENEYTNIVSYKEELTGSYYKKSDLVFVHEDFETESMKNIFENKVTHDRFPPDVHLKLAEKLRCYKTRFIYYKNWGLSSKQEKQNSIDIDYKEHIKLISTKNIPKESIPKFKITSKKFFEKSNYVIVYINELGIDTENFENKCFQNEISFLIIECNKSVKHALILHKLMKSTKKNLVYITNENTFNFEKTNRYYNKYMDFITYNMNSDNNCFDPRILKLKNTPIYFGNNEFVKKFLLIWSDNTKGPYQYLSLEYAFNISNALNKLRCFWIKDYSKKSKRNNVERNVKLLKSLEQCGLKPARKSQIEYYSKKHFSGSKTKKEQLKFDKLFIL